MSITLRFVQVSLEGIIPYSYRVYSGLWLTKWEGREKLPWIIYSSFGITSEFAPEIRQTAKISIEWMEVSYYAGNVYLNKASITILFSLYQIIPDSTIVLTRCSGNQWLSFPFIYIRNQRFFSCVSTVQWMIVSILMNLVNEKNRY